MGKYMCYVCDGKRDKNVALHRFPSDPNVRKLWARFCKLDEHKDDLSRLAICSRHFTEHDFLEPKAKILGNHLILKKGAVPSITLKKYRKGDISEPTADPHTEQSEEIIILCDVTCIENNTSDVKDTVEDTLCEPVAKKRKLNDTSNKSTQNVKGRTPHYFQPRYVGDIRPDHLTTPKNALFCMNLAKKEIAILRKTLLMEQRQKNRLLLKIKKLEDLVQHLRSKNLIGKKLILQKKPVTS